MKTIKEMNDYFEALYALGSIYVWRFNGEIINEESIVKHYHEQYYENPNSQYNSSYYENKLKEGKLKIGADCSGAFYQLSGGDNTAKGYYSSCTENGDMTTFNSSVPCMIFRGTSPTTIHHIGWYLGNGTSIEMESSTTNCQKKTFDKSKWNYWGKPKFVDYSSITATSTTQTTNQNTATTTLNGIDVSSYQGNISWDKVKSSGINFAILRGILKNGTLDSTFNANYNSAKAQGIDVACYHFSYDLSVESAKQSAKQMISALDGKKLAIWLDLEWSTQGNLGKRVITDIAKAYVNTCKSLGYDCHIYSNLNWYKNFYYPSELSAIGCKFWIAKYGVNNGTVINTNKPNVGELIWQYTSKGIVNGISGNVDMNLMYVEKTSTIQTPSSTITQSWKEQEQQLMCIVHDVTSSLRVRKEPNIESDIVDNLSNEQVINTIAVTSNGWWKISDGKYCSGKYCRQVVGTVQNCEKLSVRKESNKDSERIDTIEKGCNISVIKNENGWYYIKLSDGTVGWVSGNYIKLS